MDIETHENDDKLHVFVARQPIFDQTMEVYAYELLFRESGADSFQSNDGDKATSKVITNSIFNIGMKTLTEGKRAFINFTPKLLLDEVATLIPRELIAVEVLETVEATTEIIAACKKLKELGYMLVLDDFRMQTGYSSLIELADIIKIDIQDTPPDEIDELLRMIDPTETRLLAEKIEFREEFEKTIEAGYYTYFQGYFFCKPVTLAGQDIPLYKMVYLKLLKEIHNPEAKVDEIETAIKGDVSFAYKLLRCVNSAAFGLRHKINSIKHAIVLLGLRELKSWVSLIALQGLGENRPSELVELSIIRARFAELIGHKSGLGDRSSDLFLMGLFSLIDAIMDRPMDELLSELPFHDDIIMALIEHDGMLASYYELVLANERGEWDRFPALAAAINIDEMDISSLFIDSLAWAQEIMHGTE